jgi:anti-sigma regulatory factor (Ser/Thr protein kinase)
MLQANEINSSFYAMRLLSHRLDTSQIEVIEGEEYPASEFTAAEQEQALSLLHRIEESELSSCKELPPEKVHFYLTALADRIEDLANRDLLNAGYAVEITLTKRDELDLESPATRHQDAVSTTQGEDLIGQLEGDELVIQSPVGEDYEMLEGEIYVVEQLAKRLNFRPEVINEIKVALVEARINISEHSLSSDRIIYQRFRVENDKLVVTISSRRSVPSKVDTQEQATGPVEETSQGRRGWGLKLIKTLMDEVEFERVDESTSLRMTKYLPSNGPKDPHHV